MASSSRNEATQHAQVCADCAREDRSTRSATAALATSSNEVTGAADKAQQQLPKAGTFLPISARHALRNPRKTLAALRK
jgi:hypothetical protein